MHTPETVYLIRSKHVRTSSYDTTYKKNDTTLVNLAYYTITSGRHIYGYVNLKNIKE